MWSTDFHTLIIPGDSISLGIIQDVVVVSNFITLNLVCVDIQK